MRSGLRRKVSRVSMKDNLIDIAGSLLVFLFIACCAVGVVALVLWLADNGDKNACRNYGLATGHQVKFLTGLPNQCYVHTDQGWFLKNQIKAVETIR